MDICILQLGTFGDMILTTPVISLLKQRFPDSRIFFICGNRNHIVIRYHPGVYKILRWNKFPATLLRNIAWLRFHEFDFYVDPKDHYSFEGQMIAKIVRSKLKIGLNQKSFNFHISIQSESENLNLHFTERVLRTLKPLGIVWEYEFIPLPELYYSEENKKYYEAFLLENNLEPNGYLVFNISASHPRKTFSDHTLRHIFSNVDFNLPIVLTFEPKDTIKALDLKNKYKFLNLFFSRSILDIFPIVENSFAVVTPDTSIVHIASAYSKPTLAFYSGLDSFFKKFHPNNPFCVVVRAEKGDPGIQSINTGSFISSINSFLKTILEVL